MTRVVFENFELDDRTRDMLIEARALFGADLLVTQGSYSNAVKASAGTHDGGGVIDIRAKDLTAAQRREAIACLRRVGFAAWLRTPQQSRKFSLHIHAVAVGCADLSKSAEKQVAAYLDGRNGLANGGTDDGPRDWVTVTWEKYRKAHPGSVGMFLTRSTASAPTASSKQLTNDLTEDEMDEIRARLDALAANEANRYSDIKNHLNRIEPFIKSDLAQGGDTDADLESIKADIDNLQAQADHEAKRYSDIKNHLNRIEAFIKRELA